MATKIKTLLLSLLIIFAFNQNIRAQNDLNNDDLLLKNQKAVSLTIKNKPLSYAIKRLSEKTNINFVLSPDFQDGTISVRFAKVKPEEILRDLMNIGNFNVTRDGNSYVLRPNNLQPLIKTEVLKVKNVEAYKLAYLLSKDNSGNTNSLSYDDISNSIILTGDDDYIHSTINIISRLDIPKESYSAKLSNYNSKYVAQLIQNQFENKVQNEIDNVSGSIYLTPVLDDNAGYVIKGTVEKKELVDIQNEIPTIINDENNNQITIIGNSYQVQKAKELIKYIDEEHKEISTNTNESKQANINPQVQAIKETATNLLKDNPLSKALESANSTIERLNKELNNLQASKLWKVVIGNKVEENSYNKQILELKNQIGDLKEELAQKESLINEKNKYTAELEQKLSAKDKELEAVYKELAEIKAKLTESMLTKELANQDSTASEGSLKLLANTQEELNGTKKQLEKVKNQLNESKRQLEMIYGGTLFDITNPPNSKSGWFK